VPLSAAIYAPRLARNLRRLNDALADTALADHYWVWGGLLLGWAREGRILRHDCHDADFAFCAADRERFDAAAPALVDAGFAPRYRYRSNAGHPTEFTFMRGRAKFEFFEMAPAGDALRYFVYGGAGPLQAAAEIPAQPLEAFTFLARQWLKPRDHAAELTAMYGDWSVPNRSWSYMNDLAICSREPWINRDHGWHGELDDAPPR
jgi:hypothetical protein